MFAQDEARSLGHYYIGTEHILLGLLREEEGLASRTLSSLDITLEAVRAQVIVTVNEGTNEVASGRIPFTPRAKKVMALSLREALSLGHTYIGTEHLLLGLVRENEGIAAGILRGFGADAERIRNQIIRLLSGRGGTLRPMSKDLRQALTAVRDATAVAKEVARSDADGQREAMVDHIDHLLMMMLKPVVPAPPAPDD